MKIFDSMKQKKAITILFLLLAATGLGAKEYRKSGNTITFDKVKIDILSPSMFSVRPASGGKAEDVKTDLGVVSIPDAKVDYTVCREGESFSIRTDDYIIVYDPAKPLAQGGISVRGLIGRLDTPDSLNLGGMVGALDNCDGERCHSEQNDIRSSYDIRPTHPNGPLSRRGYTVLKHQQDMLNIWQPWEDYKELYVLCYGSDYRKGLKDFFSIAGRVPMFPQWSLGFIYSRWKDYKDTDYHEIVEGFRKRNFPIDAVILDMCWHVDNWYGYRYDTANFPDMKGFLKWAEDCRIKVGFNHHSGCIWKDDPKVRDFCRNAGLDYEASIVDGPSFEPDKRVVQYDTRNERHFKSFYDLYLKEMIADGFDFHWVDGANSIYSAELYNRYLMEDTGKRPIVLNRQQDYTLCNHRYPAAFSGDTYATWETMHREIEVTIKGGNCGIWWSHDIGGYMPQGEDGYIPDGEMFARWCQFGAFSPIMRFHAKKDVFWYPAVRNEGDWDGGSRLPWTWGGTVEESIRQSVRLRAALHPYIYANMRIAHDEGMPICRGMYFSYPEDSEAYSYDQYMFGESFLVAPVTMPSGKGQHGSTSRDIWLPEGMWYDFYTNETIEGDRTISRESDIFSMPLYVKEGAIIPTAAVGDYVEAPFSQMTLNVYAFSKDGSSTFSLYEDDGENLEYMDGKFRTTGISYVREGDLSTITVNPSEGDFENGIAEREYTLRLICPDRISEVSVNGAAAAFTENGDIFEIALGKHGVREGITIRIR